MASERIATKPFTGYAKSQRHQRTNSSAAATAAASSIITSLDMSIFTFHRRLVRCFSRLFHASTDSRRSKRQGDKKLETSVRQLIRRTNKKRTIVLDLDETLVHSTMQPPKVRFDFMVRVKIEGVVIPLFVVKRPGVNEFLERISQNYKVVVFTAGMTEYASQVLDKLDRNHVISHRLYRDSCKEVKGKYVKDLSLVEEKDLGNVLIVDDTPSSYSLQPENGVPIRPFVDDMRDRELMKLAEFFEGCHYYEDMRDAVNEFIATG